MSTPPDILDYESHLSVSDRAICEVLRNEIEKSLPDATSKIWHRHPVWFLDENPLVGYHRLKDSLRLLFWSGQSFGDVGLSPEGSFRAAEKRYTTREEIDREALSKWLTLARDIQWDYGNIVKRKGKLVRLK